MRASLSAVVLLLLASPAAGWLTDGHRKVARAAVESLPPQLPEFVRHGGDAIAHSAVDPDLMKSRQAPRLRAAESPEHYLDLELLDGHELPEDRYDHIALLHRLGERPEQVGFLPYAIMEQTERLALAFAEHRRWPENPDIQRKALVVAGLLAHYAADLVQPLHTTIHFDGRVDERGRSPRTGIHFDVDALFTRALPAHVSLGEVERSSCATGASAEALRAAVLAELRSSHALVDDVYRLEPQIRRAAEGEIADSVRAFASQRFEAAARFIATLYAMAWEMSSEIEFPPWHRRDEASPQPGRGVEKASPTSSEGG